MALTLRGLQTNALTHAQLDNNFIFLKSRDIVSVGLIGCNLTFTKDDNTIFNVNLSGCTGSGGASGDTFITTGYTSNNILYLLRNDAVTIEIPLNIELSGATVIYNNAAPTPTTIGGIPAGSSFTGKTMQQMWDSLLYPYQYPAFTSFSRTNISSQYELGEQISIGAQTFSWANSNDSNVNLGSLFIQQLSPATVTLASNLNPDVPGPSSTGLTLTTTTSSSTLASLNLYQITGVNTQAGSFSTTISRTWYPRWYYGRDTNTSLTAAQITGLTTALTSGVVNSYVTIPSDPSNTTYIYLVIPNTLSQPTDLRDSVAGCFGNNIPYSTLGAVTFNNAFGVSQTYNVYRTINIVGGALNVWMYS